MSRSLSGLSSGSGSAAGVGSGVARFGSALGSPGGGELLAGAGGMVAPRLEKKDETTSMNYLL